MSGTVACVFAGGGTGGHLYPGLAIAERLRAMATGATVRTLFLCSDRPIDAAILRAEGAAFEPLSAKPAGLRPRAMLRFLRAWPRAVRTAERLIARERDAAGGRVIVAAMGGFVAAPAVKAARNLRVPIILVNLDATPGKANRLIARSADACLTAAIGEAPDWWTRVPPIVRAAALPPGSPQECRRRLGLDPERRTLVISGGSQGAGTINDAIIALLARRPDLLQGWQVFHQCGDKGEQALKDAYAQAGVPAVVTPFHRGMGEVWGAADLAISRAGAGSVAEAWASATPTLFLPYPYHRDQHQKHNAEPLAKVGGAAILDDRIDPPTNAAALEHELNRLLRDAPALAGMRASLRSLGPADGADRVAAALLTRLRAAGA